jgi:hypothetical protein
MEQIKKVTLESVTNISEVLSSKTKKASKDQIFYKSLDFLSMNGDKEFIKLYNEIFSKNDFEETLRILNI